MSDSNLKIGSKGEIVGVWRITLGEGLDTKTFEDAWANASTLPVPVGHQTRGGIVNAAYLMRETSMAKDTVYAWVVHWLNQGGSPFGSAGAPRDPKTFLDGLDVDTSYSQSSVVLEG